VSAPRPERLIHISSGLPIGLVLGAGIWVLSASITGRQEPWDSPGLYYAAALVAAGLIGGFLVPAHWAVMAEPANGGLWPLGLLLLAFYSLLSLVGAGLGSRLRRLTAAPR
jgi:hypothetical protein